jgi:hypothetical protein
MSLEWEQAVVESRDPVALGRWWQRALDWVVVNEEATEFEIRPTADRLPGLIFVPVDEDKVVKNRIHFDFRPDNQGAEVQRLTELGASKVAVGQRDASWVVMADPEGNEFCVLRARSAAS